MVLYADDTALVATTNTYKELKRNVTEALNTLNTWAQNLKMTFNKEKTRALFFGLKPNQERPTFLMEGTRIRCVEQLEYLGITIDAQLKWIPHINKVCAKAKTATHQLRTACKLTWGLDRGAMADIYVGAIEPAMTYGASIWADGCKGRQASKLLSVQRLAAIGAAAVYRTTSTEAALVLANLRPVDLVIRKLGERRKATRKRDQAILDELGIGGTQLETEPNLEAEKHVHPVEQEIGVHLEGSGEEHDNRIYTDASRNEEGAGAAYIVYHKEEEIAAGSTKISRTSSTFQAELVAIREALAFLTEHQHTYQHCAIISDSKSALTAVRNARRLTGLLQEVRAMARQLSRTTTITWHWVKAHSGNKGNERANEMARTVASATGGEIGFEEIPASAVKKMMRARTTRRWDERWRNATTGRLTAAFIPTLGIRQGWRHRLDYETAQMVSGHGAFNTYLRKIGKREDGTCECGAGDDDTEHVLFQCRTYDDERREAQDQLQRDGEVWPTTLEEVTTLAGSRTRWSALARFVKQTGKFKIARE